MKRFILAATSAVALVAAAAPASAAITIYTTQAAFNAATQNRATDTFENFSITTTTPSPITRAVGSYGYTAAATTSSFYGAGTTADRWLSTNIATDNIVFSSFTGGVSALGGLFFGSDIDGAFLAAPSITLNATDASGTVTQTIANPTTSSFVGFVSTTGLLSFTVNSPTTGATNIWPTVNNLVLGQRANATPAVPEPATWGLMLAGFGMVGFGLRARKQARVTFA